MEQIHVTLPDGSVKEVPKGTTPIDIAKSISPRLADAALVAKVYATAGKAQWKRPASFPTPWIPRKTAVCSSICAARSSKT